MAQAFSALTVVAKHPGLAAARGSLLDLLWHGFVCAPSLAEKAALTDALPVNNAWMAALERLALTDEDGGGALLRAQAANLLV